jgi:pimeloyl-ACP methyl ester carboxylesterase
MRMLKLESGQVIGGVDTHKDVHVAMVIDHHGQLVGTRSFDTIGYSMGGGVALQLAMSRPGMVRRLVFAGGTSYRRDGLYPEMLAEPGPAPEELNVAPSSIAVVHPSIRHRSPRVAKYTTSKPDRAPRWCHAAVTGTGAKDMTHILTDVTGAQASTPRPPETPGRFSGCFAPAERTE